MNTKKIISIDDDVDFNNLLTVLFKKHDLKIKTFEQTEGFINSFKQAIPDLAIIDINLSEKIGAGYQLIKAIRNKYGFDVPIIVLSKRTDPGDISNALEIGATDFVPKPLDDYLLFHKVNSLLFRENASKKLFRVPEKLTYSKLSFKQKIEKVSEFGLTIIGQELISKGTILNIQGNAVESITGSGNFKLTVTKTWLNQDDKFFRAYLEFDPNNEKVLSHVRKWIRDQRL